MEVVVLENLFFDILKGFRSIKENSLWYDDTCATTDLEHLRNVLEKEHLRCIRLEWEVYLYLFFDFSTKGGIREDNIMSIAFLNIFNGCCEGISF